MKSDNKLWFTTHPVVKAVSFLGIKHHIESTRVSEWKRIFLTDNSGQTIGRISIWDNNHDVVYPKWYFKFEVLKEGAFIWYQYQWYMATGHVLTMSVYFTIVLRATKIKKQDIKNKLEIRQNLPKKSRKKIEDLTLWTCFQKEFHKYKKEVERRSILYRIYN